MHLNNVGYIIVYNTLKVLHIVMVIIKFVLFTCTWKPCMYKKRPTKTLGTKIYQKNRNNHK